MTEKTVLVVDDNAGTCELIQEILSTHHYHVLVAHDGLEAVEWTNHGHVDLILMDIQMPFFSGFWFCAVLKRKKNTSNIPIVMVSAMLDEDNIERAHEVGACDCVKKPFSCEELLEVVERNASH